MHCRRQLGGLAEVQSELAAEGIGVAAIAVDEPADSAALARRLGVQFPLLSDPDAQVITSYGVKMKDQVLAVPATFVVGEDRTILWHYVGDTKPDRPAIDVVRQAARRSQ